MSFFDSFEGEGNGEPDDQVDDDEDGSVDGDDLEVKGDPRIEQMAGGIGKVERAEMEQNGLADRPMLDLIEDAGARVEKGRK